MNDPLQTAYAVLDETVKRFLKTEPSLPDVADVAKSTVRELEKIATLSDIDTPAFSSALRYAKNAYQARDERDVAMRNLELAASSLKQALNEIEEVKTIKSVYNSPNRQRDLDEFFGEQSVYYEDPEDFTFAYQMQQKIKGLKSNPMGIDPMKLRQLAETIEDELMYHPEGSRSYDSLVSAHDEISRAYKSFNESSQQQNLSRAIKAFDNLAQSGITHDYTPELSLSHDDVYEAINDMHTILSYAPYNTPSEVFPELLAKARSVKSFIGRHFDPKAQRTINRLVERIETATQLSQSRGMKSQGGYGWIDRNNPQFQQLFDLISIDMADLQAQVMN